MDADSLRLRLGQSSARRCPRGIREKFTQDREEESQMAEFDPDAVRKAVAAFTPRRPRRFHELAPAKEVIAELRHKGASYPAIFDLLTVHCLTVSKTSVAAFCHTVLGEPVRPKRRQNRKRTSTPPSPNADSGDKPTPQIRLPRGPNPDEAQPGSAVDTAEEPRSRGPRIAQVRMVNPPTS